jgi:hypothetical protein
MSEHKPQDKPARTGTPPDATPSGEPASRIPPGAPRLRKGDRVTFELGEGVDGPPYAMNVRLIDEDGG